MLFMYINKIRNKINKYLNKYLIYKQTKSLYSQIGNDLCLNTEAAISCCDSGVEYLTILICDTNDEFGFVNEFCGNSEKSVGLSEILKDKSIIYTKSVKIIVTDSLLIKTLPKYLDAIHSVFEDLLEVKVEIYSFPNNHCIVELNKILDCYFDLKYIRYSFFLIGQDGKYNSLSDERLLYSDIRSIGFEFNDNHKVDLFMNIDNTNIWDVDDLFYFIRFKNNNIRFLLFHSDYSFSNPRQNCVFVDFDDDEKYHLILFFYKLIFEYEKDESFQRTYYSVINILSGGDRLIGCPYQANRVVLNSRGEIAYCAPKSVIIGNAQNVSAKTLYVENINELNRIKKDYCKSCIHDYHSPITANEVNRKRETDFWKLFINLNSKNRFIFHKNISAKRISNQNQIFITGWYGTETVGDKAILGGIIEDLFAECGKDVDIVVSSLYPQITIRTLIELKISAKVIDAYSEDFVAYSKGSDLVIMGGGPLMDLDELALPLIAFKLAKSAHKRTKIYGCGIGPLFNEKYINAVKEILHYSDEILLRDSKSVEIASKWMKSTNKIKLSGDYAKQYLLKYIDKPIAITTEKVLTCYLRELTHEYFGNLSELEFLDLKKRFETSLAKFILEKATDYKVDKIHLEHMHNFVVGGDDRDFSRYFIDTYFEMTSIPVTYNKKLSTVESIVSSMQTSTLNVCMRFHSVLFAQTLKTEFIALDYTVGGKIYNFLSDNEMLEKLMTVDTLIRNY